MIDDDPVFLNGYKSLLDAEYVVHGAQTISDGLKLIEKFAPEVLLLDISLKTEKEGLAVLPNIKKAFPHLPIIIVTNWDSHLIFKEAILLGADDFFVKSDNVRNLKVIIKNLLYQNQINVKDETGFPIAYSSVFKQILVEAKKVAGLRCTVLITGETGVGKEEVAKYIHRHSKRHAGPFIPVNCGSIPETLFESEMFGYEKGAFTGAFRRKKGKFELADQGTLFLDEVEELSAQTQPKLLRVLQEQEIEHIGGTQRVPVDVRIIAAAQHDLRVLVEKGKFREDLYYRLAVYPLHIPPLREREEDIIPLANYFLKYFQEKYKRGKKRLTQSALIMLTSYHWPGNVRELKNSIERAVVGSVGSEIRPSDFQLRDVPDNEIGNLSYDSAKNEAIYAFQRSYIKRELYRSKGNISLTAKKIGISRQALTKMMKDLNLGLKKVPGKNVET